ncbi:Phomenoic acid biosynthesis cluster-specific transcriptional regulator-like protein [Cladobotryum mycophilum]|uniref:Phomenoic acid biosynthesis cluster-specific transcriptional regulator-like protein n=1 Tax=Cladobotryum mycophilum TaxID=491253 RepID=A0ABR0SA11_9HYPO
MGRTARPLSNVTQCWECLRRKTYCDGTLPVCDICRRAGIVCPGFGDRKPLTWLPPGKVSRLPNGRTIKKMAAKSKAEDAAAAAAPASKTKAKTKTKLAIQQPSPESLDWDGEPESDESSESGDDFFGSGITVRRQRARGGQQRQQQQQHYLTIIPMDLRPEDWDYIDNVNFWNSQVVPSINTTLVKSRHKTFRMEDTALRNMKSSCRHAFSCLSLSIRILCVASAHGLYGDTTNSGPVAHLWSSFYRQLSQALPALNEEIRMSSSEDLSDVFTSIHFIIIVEAFITHNRSQIWRTHAAGFLSLMNHCGGLRALISSPPTPRGTLLRFIIYMTQINSTGPRRSIIKGVCDLDTDDISKLYSMIPNTVHLCPASLFIEIFRINRLRLQEEMNPSQLFLPGHSPLCDILKRIDAVPPQMGRRGPLPLAREHPTGRPALQIRSRHGMSCDRLIAHYRAKLFEQLGEAIAIPIRIDNIFWPVLVAGVAAGSGYPAERALVDRYISMAVRDPFMGNGPPTALWVMRRFWDSGRTGWDDCFDQSYPLLA